MEKVYPHTLVKIILRVTVEGLRFPVKTQKTKFLKLKIQKNQKRSEMMKELLFGIMILIGIFCGLYTWFKINEDNDDF